MVLSVEIISHPHMHLLCPVYFPEGLCKCVLCMLFLLVVNPLPLINYWYLSPYYICFCCYAQCFVLLAFRLAVFKIRLKAAAKHKTKCKDSQNAETYPAAVPYVTAVSRQQHQANSLRMQVDPGKTDLS